MVKLPARGPLLILLVSVNQISYEKKNLSTLWQNVWNCKEFGVKQLAAQMRHIMMSSELFVAPIPIKVAYAWSIRYCQMQM